MTSILLLFICRKSKISRFRQRCGHERRRDDALGKGAESDCRKRRGPTVRIGNQTSGSDEVENVCGQIGGNWVHETAYVNVN